MRPTSTAGRRRDAVVPSLAATLAPSSSVGGTDPALLCGSLADGSPLSDGSAVAVGSSRSELGVGMSEGGASSGRRRKET
jgi:hypothetical protein